MQTNSPQHIQIAIQLLIIACAIVAGVWVAQSNKNDLATQIEGRLTTQVALLKDLAVVTDRNGADPAIATIISDCPRREEYESLLIKLGMLTKKDLVTMQSLFESCGSFYAERKALMVAKIERELDEYLSLIEFLEILDGQIPDSREIERWKEIVTLEKNRSELLTDQNIIQAEIITLLISGSTVQSKEVSTLVLEAQEIGELLSVSDQKIDVLRNDIEI